MSIAESATVSTDCPLDLQVSCELHGSCGLQGPDQAHGRHQPAAACSIPGQIRRAEGARLVGLVLSCLPQRALRAEARTCCRVCRMLLSTRWMESQLRSLSPSPSHPSCMVSLTAGPLSLSCRWSTLVQQGPDKTYLCSQASCHSCPRSMALLLQAATIPRRAMWCTTSCAVSRVSCCVCRTAASMHQVSVLPCEAYHLSDTASPFWPLAALLRHGASCQIPQQTMLR